MNIRDAYNRLESSTSIRIPRVTEASSTTSNTNSTTTDADGVKVKVSQRATELARQAETDGSSRVEQLRAQVRSGRYHVDAYRIAAKLVGGDEP